MNGTNPAEIRRADNGGSNRCQATTNVLMPHAQRLLAHLPDYERPP
jgi:hypothetical protein